MKQKLLVWLIGIFAFLNVANAQINMPKTDGATTKHTISEPQKFYDPEGENSTFSRMYGNTRIVFTPQNGQKIKISFESLTLKGATIHIFDGEKNFDTEYDSLEEEEVKTLPTGARVKLASLGNEKTFTSNSSDGKITIFLSCSGGSGDWVANVESVVAEAPKPVDAKSEENMQIGHKILNVNGSIKFYDDGGKDRNISNNFEGSVTFLPKNPNKKIRITFNKLDLFNTNTLRNDILKIYNGTEVKEEKLLATLLKEPTPIVLNSNADDGSLTITLKSTTGVTKSGFEAVVEEFSPTQMIFDKISIVDSVANKAYAGEDGVLASRFSIDTRETLNPISAQAITLNIVNPEKISKIKVYYEGRNAKENGTLFAETNNISASTTITASSSKSLLEGKNYFRVELQINEQAKNNENVSIQLASVNVGNQSHSISDAQAKTISFENVVISKEGSRTINLYDEWKFTHEHASQYSTKYKAGTTEQITTFITKEAGAVVELDFKKFDIYYSSNSNYGERAIFDIYDANGKNGKKLFSVDATNKNKFPNGGKIRSTGNALTVVFNPHTSTSGYTANGWEAVARSYKSKDMTVISTNVEQASTEDLQAGAKNQVLLKLNIETSGNLSTINLESIDFGLKNSLNAIEKIHIYNSEDETLETSEQIASSNSLSETTKIILNNYNLKEGSNTLYISVDVNSSAAPETKIDLAIKAIKFSNSESKNVENGDPDGERTVKAVYLWKDTDDTLQLGDYPIEFYDKGGKNGKFNGANAKHTLVVRPKAGQSVKLHINSCKISYTQKLSIYNGSTADKNNLLKEIKGSSNNNDLEFISTASDGALTIIFENKTGRQYDGWDAVLSSYVKKNLEIKNIELSQVKEPLSILAGQSNFPVIKASIDIEGDMSTINLPAISLRLDKNQNSSVSKANIYFTSTNDAFATFEKLGEANLSDSNNSIELNKSIDKAGKYYIWIAVDAPSSLQGSETSSLTATINEQTKTAQISVKSGKSGKFIVGASSSAQYHSLSEAWSDLKSSGINGEVELLIEDGTYTEAINLSHIDGVSETNRIKISSLSKDAEKVKFEFSLAKTDKQPSPVIIDEVDYLSIENISFSTTKKDYEAILTAKNSKHLILKNNKFTAPRSSNSTGQTISLVSIKGNNVIYQNSDYAIIEGNTFDGGYKGLELNGTGYVKLRPQEGAKVIANKFQNQGVISIYASTEKDVLIEKNKITNSGSIKEYKPIDATMIGATIRANEIKVSDIEATAQGYNSKNGNIYPIYLRAHRIEGAYQDIQNKIYNNTIEIIVDNKMDEISAINISDANLRNILIAHNTIVLKSKTESYSHKSEVAAIKVAGKSKDIPENIKIEGNLIQTNIANAFIYRVQIDAHKTAITCNHNAFKSANASIAKIGSANKSLTDWRSLGFDTNGVEQDARFQEGSFDLLEDSNLNIVPNIDGINIDIVGRERSASKNHTAGAYEYKNISIPDIELSSVKATSVKSTSAIFTLIASASGKVYAKLVETSASAPTLDEMKSANSFNVVEGKESEISLQNLKANTSYTLYILPASSDNKFANAVIQSISIKTEFMPTTIATFESVETNANQSFTDGTFDFDSFDIRVEKGINDESKRIAYAQRTAKITLNNTDNGIAIDGLFIKSDKAISINSKGTKDGAESNHNETFNIADKGWVYISLSKFAPMKEFSISSESDFYIDNVGAKALPLRLANVELDARLPKGDKTFSKKADVEGGAFPYSYAWKELNGKILSSEESISIQMESTKTLILEVQDALGNTISKEFVVSLSGVQTMAGFEDLPLEDESHWIGNEDNMQSTFISGSYKFTNTYIKDWQTWGGFAYSNRTATTYKTLFPDQFNSAVGSGATNSRNYAVVYTMGARTEITPISDIENGEDISGFYISNTAWVKHVSQNGPGMGAMANQAFTNGDYLRLTISADNGKKIEYYLADYRSADTREHYTLDTWQWVDLRSLGKVKKLSFKIDGSRVENGSTLIPAYFVMDNFGGEVQTKELKAVSIVEGKTKDTNLAELLNEYLPTEWKSFAKYELIGIDNNKNLEANLNDKNLNIKALAEANTSIRIKASGKGESLYFDLPIEIKNKTSIDAIDNNLNFVAYPNPAIEMIRFNRSGKLAIYDLNGIVVYQLDNYNANEYINISKLGKANYIVKIDNATTQISVR